MRVPPDQSSTARTTDAIASSGSRDASARVIGVRRVPKTKVETFCEPRRASVDSACAKCSSIRE